MTLAIVGPLLTFIGLFIGAYFARNREMEKFRKDKITEAYARLLDAAANSSGPISEMLMHKRLMGEVLSAQEAESLEKSQARWVNAHSSVVLHGSKAVVQALSNFYEASARAKAPDPATYIELIKAMRHDSEAEDYAEFGAHVDNILGSGAARRAAAMRRGAVTFGQPQNAQQ